MNIELNIGSGRAAGKKSRPSTANVLVLGDFSGGSKAADEHGGIRNMFTFDPNQIDSAVARVAPSIAVAIDSTSIAVGISTMDDFHPDTLLTRDALFRSLPSAPVEEEAQTAADATKQPENAEVDDFTRLLGGTASAPKATSSAVRSTLDKLIATAVEDEPEAVQSSRGDAASSGDREARLRSILRTPGFQQLESRWRSMQWLGERIDYDESASVWLVDVDIASIGSWKDELLRQVAAGPGSAEALIVLQDFADSDEDLETMNNLADLAARLSTVAFAGAGAELTGLEGSLDRAVALDASDFKGPRCESLGSGGAHSRLVLGFPHVLLRQPYGKRSDPIDAFDFDELGTAPPADAFLWGCASILLAWMSLSDSLIADDALLVTYDDGGGQAIKPPTGAYMTDSAADELISRGIVPLLSTRGGTDIRVPRLQSVAGTAV